MERGLDVRPEVQAAMVDFQVPFPLNEMAEAFSTNPRLQLLMRLVKFVATESGPDVTEWEWTMPKEVPPAELERMKKVIEQFLETPINLQGKKASELMTKTSQRRRRSPSPSASESGSESSGGQGEFDDKKNSKKKKGRKARTKDRSENTRKERQQQEYKSAQFIEDSDEEYGDIDAFLEKEKVMRERILLQIEKTGMEAPMQKTGTKKRRKKDGLEGSKRKKKRPDEEADDVFESQPVAQTRPRPKPKPIFKAKADELPVDSTMDVDEDSQHDSGSAALDAADPDSDSACPRRRPRRTVAISDDDDDVDE
ncbi:unnamed protein product [Mycena citricolor]|uniref:Uncharacterized protein n=1 Tax=Mycena citricolor TaxID=2018698 RepID=A0AAD2HLS2_9AGAR|nr:unnamed protein product [Mycena citricolor]